MVPWYSALSLGFLLCALVPWFGTTWALEITWSRQSAQAIPDRYILLFRSGLDKRAIQHHFTWLAAQIHGRDNATHPFNHIRHHYNISGMRGYAGQFDARVIRLLRDAPEVPLLLSNLRCPPG
jgi:hypothetical protein